MADVVISVVPFLSPTSTGNLDVVADGSGGLKSLGGKTPKAVIIVGGAAGDNDTTETVDARMSIGFAVNGGAQSVHSCVSRDAQTSTTDHIRYRTNAVLRAGDTTAGFLLASVNSWLTNGVRLNFSAVAGTARRYFAILIAGDDVQANAGIITFATDTDPTYDVTAPGFTPDLVLLSSNCAASAVDSNNNIFGILFGAAVNGGGQACVVLKEAHGVASGGQPTQAIYDNVAHASMAASTGVIAQTGVVNDFDASGFSLDLTGSTLANENVAYLALSFGGAGVHLQSFAVPTATGPEAFTGCGFLPQAAIIGASSRATANASSFNASDCVSIGLGATDGYSERAQSIRIHDTADPTDTAELCSPNALAVGTQTDPDATRATFDYFASDELGLDFGAVTGTATLGFMVLVEEGDAPPIETDARISQVARLSLAGLESDARVSQVVQLSLAQMEADPRISQVARLTLCEYQPCHTRRAQLWRITRRDGTQLAFTSHDRPITFGPLTYSPCDSLQASASQNAADMEGTSNVEFSGIIADDAISAQDVEAGLYDDAYVEVYLVSWQAPDDAYISADTVRRLVAGWVGEISTGERGLTMEVLGPGQRLAQKSMVEVYGSGCRFLLGDSNCTVDIEALKLGGVVTSVQDNGEFTATLSASTGGAQYDQGFVRWLTGANAGVDCEVKTAAFATGDVVNVVLWAPAPFLPEVGATFDLYPGCDRLAATCKDVYANKANFGGFDKIPGNDAIAKTPDAKH